jgi:excisionase family DNA binding protein
LSKLQNIDWAATRLNEPKHRVYRWAREGVIPVVRLGRRMKVDPEILEEWIAAGGSDYPGGWRRKAE